MAGPLEDIRVLDMSRILAGPWASQLLGDYGADIVKIERPHCGDDTRQWGPPWLDGESAYFLAANRNKRSVTIDIASDGGQELVRQLAREADVLIENYKTGTLARFGLDGPKMLRLNPALVYCSISAFGQTGSRAAEPGYDAMIQASAGLMSITGSAAEEGGKPQKVGVAISDIMAGMYATTAILAALHARNQHGRGQCIDVPLYDSQVAWLANQALNYLVGGEVPARLGTAHPNLVPYQVFDTSDGELMLAVGNDRQFANCCDVLGLGHLAHDARFETADARVVNRADLIPLLQIEFGRDSRDSWLEKLRKYGVPAGPVNDIAEVLGNEHARERRLVRQLHKEAGDPVPIVANPVDFSATPVSYKRVPPRLGQHTDEVLRDWLGYSDADIESLRTDSVIQ